MTEIADYIFDKIADQIGVDRLIRQGGERAVYIAVEEQELYVISIQRATVTVPSSDLNAIPATTQELADSGPEDSDG